MKKNLARYKVPREIVFLDELPRNATGKVLKRELEGRGGGDRPRSRDICPHTGYGSLEPRGRRKVWIPE